MSKLWVSGLVVALVLGGSGLAGADDRRESVPLAQAIGCLQAAVAAQPGRVEELEIKREGNRLVCEVDIVNGRELFEVKVDANTRQILRVERD